MALDLARLGLEVDSSQVKKASGDLDRFSRDGKQAAGSAEKVGKSGGVMAAGMTKAAGAIAAVVASMAAIGGGIRTIADFERQISTVGAVSRATTDELAAMRDIAAELGSTTEFTGKQAAEGLEFLARAGFSAGEAIEAIPAVLDLATASALGLGQAADISSNIMSAFGIAASDSASVADILAAASSRANTDVSQLGAAMSFVGPVASALGIQMSDAAAAIGVLSDAGIQGSAAGTGLRRVLSSLANPTKEAASVLASLGLTMEELNPQTNDIADIVDRLAGAGLSAAGALTVFGDRGGPAILALTSQTGRLRELTGALTGVEGEAKRMADTMRDNLGGDTDSLFSSIQGLVLALGEAALTAVIRTVVQVLTALTRGITALVNVIGGAIGAVTGFFSALFTSVTNEQLVERAIDNATIAMGDQRAQLKLLNADLRERNRLTEETARVRQATAEREIRIIQQQEAAARSAFLDSAGFDDLLSKSEELRARLNEIRDQIPGSLAQGVQNQFVVAEAAAERALADILTKIEQIRISAEGGFLSDADAERLRNLQIEADVLGEAIGNAKDGMVDFTDETAEGVRLTDRLAIIAGTITFASATESARALADQLGIALDNAVGANNALNRAAGISQPGPTTLGFNAGVPEGAIPGGFVGSGGTLSFGPNLGAARPEDFIPERAKAGTGGRRAAASEAERQADATQKVVDALKAEIEAVGMSEEARRTQQALLRAGVDAMSEEGQAIAGLVAEYTRLSEAQKANEAVARTLKDAILDFAENGADAIDNLAKSIKRMALEALLFGEGPLGGLFGGASGKGLLGGLVSSIAGGFDSGGIIPSGKIGAVAGFGSELVNGGTLIRGPARVTSSADTARMMQGGGRSEVVVRLAVPEGVTIEESRQIAGDIAVQVTSEGISRYDRSTLPSSFERISRDPKRRG